MVPLKARDMVTQPALTLPVRGNLLAPLTLSDSGLEDVMMPPK